MLVDDGSARPVAQRCVAHGRLRILRQENRGRFEARRAGIEAANGEYVLLLDSRVTLDPSGVAGSTTVSPPASAHGTATA